MGTCWDPCLGTCSWEPLGIFANLLLVITCSWEPCLGTWLRNLLFGTLLRNLFLRTFRNPGNLFLRTLLGNLASEPLPGNLGNLAWESVPENFRQPCLGTCSWELCLGTCFGNLWESFQTCSWEPCFGTSSWGPWEPCLAIVSGSLSQLWETCLETLLGDFAGEPCLEIWLGNLVWKPTLGNLFLGTLLGNLVLGTFKNFGNLFLGSLGTLVKNLAWELCFGMFGNLFLGTFGNLAWTPCLGNLLGNLAWEPGFGTLLGQPCLGTGTLGIQIFAAPTCSGTFTMAESLSLRCWGNMFLESLLANRFFETLIENFSWNSCLGTFAQEPLLGNLFLGTLATSSWEPCLEPLPGNLCEPGLGTLLGNLAWKPVPENLAWEPLPGNLAWESLPGNLAWEPLPRNLAWAQWDFGCSDLLRDLYYGWRPQAYAVGEKDSAPRSSIALLEWLLSTDVRGVWDTATSEVFIYIGGLFWYMLPCKHHCMPQSTSLFYLRVALGCLQLLRWEESNQAIEQFITSIWVWVHTRDVQLNYLTILWWSKTLRCLPQLWTLVSGVLEVSRVLKQFSDFTVSSPAVDKPEHNVTKLTNLTNLTKLTHFWPTWPTWPMFDQPLTKFWPSFPPTWLDQLFTNFAPTWPTYHQLDQIDLTTNNQLRSRLNWIGSALAMPAKIARTYWITTTVDYEPNNCHQSSIWGSLKMRCPFFHLKFISYSFLLIQYPFGGSTHENW